MRLIKRVFKKVPPAVTDALPLPEPVVVEEPEYEPRTRNKLPSGKISITCESCGAAVVLYVEFPDNYDEAIRKKMFKQRGSSYKPPRCRWCVGKPNGYWKQL